MDAEKFIEFVKGAGCELLPYQEEFLRRGFSSEYVMVPREVRKTQLNRAHKALKKAGQSTTKRITQRDKFRIIYNAMIEPL